MVDTAKRFCSILFDVLQAKGIRNVVCSPGSRNVPLLLAVAQRDDLKKHFVVDERSAAFVALGIAMVTKEPVVLVCTSGTALLDYSPAIAEAYYQALPLIVISADRPVQWIDQDDSQTLRQDNALANFVKKSYSIPSLGEDEKEMQWYVNRIANDAVIEACDSRPGPVHINIHLAEPLGKTIKQPDDTQRIIRTLRGETIGNKEEIRELAETLANSKVLLVAGFSLPDSLLQKEIAHFCQMPNVAVMAETISNLHLANEMYSVDSVLTAYDETELDNLAPDVVISIGGALVSRKLKEYLRRNSSRVKHWSVGYSHTTTDPFTSLSLRIEALPYRFFRGLNNAMRKMKITESCVDYQRDWSLKRKKASIVKNSFIEGSPWSELKAFNFILNHVPSDYNLFLSNGTAIRYAQIIPYRLPHASYCNRGVSGIDGSLSSAIGGGIAYKGKTLLITGDLSMAYDVGALGIHEIPESFKIIVMDNQGGGIFRFIPATSGLDICEEYLCQDPLLPLRQLAEGYGWEYFECNREKTLEKTLKDFFASKSKAIFRITCDGKLSAEILKEYMQTKV